MTTNLKKIYALKDNVYKSISYGNEIDLKNLCNIKEITYSYNGSIHSFRRELFKSVSNPKYNDIYQYIYAFKETLPIINIGIFKGIVILIDENNYIYIKNDISKNKNIMIFNLCLMKLLNN